MTLVDQVDDIGFVDEQIELEARDHRTERDERSRRADTIRPILWRLHFVGGFLAGPIIISLAVSGILFAWNAQIDDARFGDILRQSPPAADVPLAGQVRAATAAHPDWAVHAVVPGTGDRTTAVLMDPPGGAYGFGGVPTDGVNVHVNRSDGAVTGEIATTDTADAILRGLHSSWRLGPNVEPVTELAGSLFLVSLLTGLYLWWPGLRKRGSIAFAARRGLRGRRRDKEWHNFIGVTLVVPMVFLVVTGLAWTQFAGTRVTMVGNAVSPAAGGVDGSLGGGHGGHGAGGDAATGQQDIANIDRVWVHARTEGLVDPVTIAVPKDHTTAWTATSGDQVFPVEQDAIAVDGATGEVTSRFDYRDEHWFNKLSTAGTFFHEGKLFGVFSQVLMSLLSAAIVAMIVFGYRMWWRRRPAGGMGTPPPIRDWARNAPVAVLAATAFLAWAMPVLALAIVVWLVVEAGWRWLEVARGEGAAVPVDGAPTGPMALLEAGVILGLGVAMVAAPSIGDAESATYWTMPRMVAWAWSRPLGLLLAVIGLLGVYAVGVAGRRPSVASRA